MLRLSDRKAQPFLRTPFNESAPRFSPDGHWLAYVSDESGRYEIYVQPYPGPGGKWQISTEGGTEPVWNPNGRELFYRSGEQDDGGGHYHAAEFCCGQAPRCSSKGSTQRPGSDFRHQLRRVSRRPALPDAQATEQAQAAPTQINVVLNWFEELKQKVPTGKK